MQLVPNMFWSDMLSLLRKIELQRYVIFEAFLYSALHHVNYLIPTFSPPLHVRVLGGLHPILISDSIACVFEVKPVGQSD